MIVKLVCNQGDFWWMFLLFYVRICPDMSLHFVPFPYQTPETMVDVRDDFPRRWDNVTTGAHLLAAPAGHDFTTSSVELIHIDPWVV